MGLTERCVQCGTTNIGGEPQPTGSSGCREIAFTCDECGASGTVTTHTRAGILGRSGEYFKD